MAGDIKSLEFSDGVSVTSPSDVSQFPTLTTTERDAISSPATGYQIFNTTTNKINVYNGTSWEAPAIFGVGDNSAVYAVSSTNYTVLDDDSYRTLLVTTGASDRTITLPTAADNTNRTLVIKKVDSGAGDVIIDGEGAETIDGATTKTMWGQYTTYTIVCDGTSWHIVDRELSHQSWTSFTPTLSSGFGSATISEARWRRSGLNTMDIIVKGITGTTSTGNGTITIPSSLNVDIATSTVFGKWYRDTNSASASKNGTMLATTGNTAILTMSDDEYTEANGPFTFVGNVSGRLGSTEGFQIEIKGIPISEWGE